MSDVAIIVPERLVKPLLQALRIQRLADLEEARRLGRLAASYSDRSTGQEAGRTKDQVAERVFAAEYVILLLER